jgi:hypothetical protein
MLAPRLAPTPCIWSGLERSGWDENHWYDWISLIAVRAEICLVMRRSGVQIPEAARGGPRSKDLALQQITAISDLRLGAPIGPFPSIKCPGNAPA